MKKILVTGGAGFIGSHTCLELIAAGYEPVVLDNFSNSSPVALERMQELAGRSIECHRIDLRADLNTVFKHGFDAVIHFAGLKAVGESVAQPLKYYDNNVAGTVNLLQTMTAHGVFNLVFSSSATVYGVPETTPIPETAKLGATNPYGRSKLHIEEMLRDVALSEPRWHMALLRYFNPVGAHPSGRIGEDPEGIPNNLMPFMMQTATGKRERLQVFGNDYDTKDGTGVRDYIHVMDLARGHVSALQHLHELAGAVAINLGTGTGYSVLEMVAAVSRVIGKPLPYQIVARRPGDVAASVASPNLARERLGWTATRGLDDICADSWRWQSKNPNGYR